MNHILWIVGILFLFGCASHKQKSSHLVCRVIYPVVYHSDDDSSYGHIGIIDSAYRHPR